MTGFNKGNLYEFEEIDNQPFAILVTDLKGKKRYLPKRDFEIISCIFSADFAKEKAE